MSITVTRTKVIVPRRRPDLLSRKRLLDLLDDLLDYRLTLIAAPAGYGKTSLLVDLAHQVEYPVCWYALDSLDGDFLRFAQHFVASIQEHFPSFGKNSIAVIQSASQSGFDFNHLVATVVNDVYEHISEHFVIVLDDYHLVDGSKDVNQFVSRFGQEMDENCHLVVASRTLLSLPDLPLMVGRSQVKGLSFDELAFRPEEIKSLLQRNYNQLVSDEEADEMARESDGWITGLLLSAETMVHGMRDRARVAQVSGVGLYDYLAQQVLDQQAPPVREFLLQSSLLEEFDAELCQTVLGDPPEGESWFNLIATVLHKNLFVQPVDNGGTWLRYHHLFRDFLQDRLASEQPEEKKIILHRLTDAYTNRQQWEKAFTVCRRLDDDQITADLIDQASPALARSGRMKKLAEWLDILPDDILCSRPLLLAQRGAVAAFLGDVDKGLSLLNKAESILQDKDDLQALARTLTWRATSHRFLGNQPASLEDANKALNLVEGKDHLNSIRAEALRIKGLALNWLGRANEACAPLEQAVEIYDSLDDDENSAIAHMDLGFVFMSVGQHLQALSHYHHALDIWRETNNLIRQANLLNNMGVLAHAEGDLLQAEAYFTEALTGARQSGYSRIEAFTLASLGDLFVDLGFFEDANEYYQRARKIAQSLDEQFLLLYLRLADAKVAWSNNNLSEAKLALKEVESSALESKSSYESGLWSMEEGRILLTEGEMAGAINSFEKAIRDFEAGGQRLEAAKAHLNMAIAKYQLGDGEVALSYLSNVSEAVSELGSLYLLVSVARGAKAMLEEASSTPNVGEFASCLLEQVNQFDEQRPRLRRQIRRHTDQIIMSPPALNIQTFGLAQVQVNGVLPNKPEWTNQKMVRELFYLLMAHPEGLTKESLGEILWFDSSPENLKMQFKNAIYRLRRALGKEVILFEQGSERYQFNWELDYQYDVEVFKGTIERAKRSQDHQERVRLFEKAISLYRGDYLVEAEGVWVTPIRQNLRRLYIGATINVAESYYVIADYDRALVHCSELFAGDPCNEVAYRLVMRIHAAQGNRAEVARQFERCRQSLLEHLDTTPSPETEELYEKLM